MDDEEEVLLALAETLNHQFLDFVGGPAYALHITKILEKLCQLDEATVRDKACESIKKIFAQLRLKDIEPQVMEIIKRLMNGENYQSKFGATSLIPTVYQHLSPASQQELLAMYIQVSQDDIPQVRKVAAIVLNEMIKLMPRVPEQELLKVFGQFFKDEQDSVKMQGIDSCVTFCKHLPA